MSPSSWLVAHADMLPRTGLALDLASGRGRNALWLAEHGMTVVALDRNEHALADLREEAARRGLTVLADLADFESGDFSFHRAAFDLIVVTHYLYRPLFPGLVAALKPGGLLIYETFTVDQARRGKPTNPDFLLEPGELVRLVQPLEIVDSREGTFEERDVAAVVARKPVT
jgi:tellurite methyltransferase